MQVSKVLIQYQYKETISQQRQLAFIMPMPFTMMAAKGCPVVLQVHIPIRADTRLSRLPTQRCD